MNNVYVGLGSNVSPRVQYIQKAAARLRTHFPQGFKHSSMYMTDPYQGIEQDQFVNCCVYFETTLEPEDTIKRIWEIESELGRIRGEKRWMARTIDIDILLWNQDLISSENLTIPHYDLSQRDFFLIPLVELDENLINPKTGVKLQSELANIPEKLKTHPNRMDTVLEI